MRLAILPLIQVATLPRFMMRSPERFVLAPPGSMFAFHSALLNLKHREQNRWRTQSTEQACEKWTLTVSLLPEGCFPALQIIFPVIFSRENAANPLINHQDFTPKRAISSKNREFSLYLPI
jgi:hypothetical protein